MKTYTAETSSIIELLLIIILSEPQSKAAIDLVLGICLPVHVEPSDILHGSSCNLIMVTSAALVVGHCLEAIARLWRTRITRMQY